jgi:hypothetical protein
MKEEEREREEGGKEREREREREEGGKEREMKENESISSAILFVGRSIKKVVLLFSFSIFFRIKKLLQSRKNKIHPVLVYSFFKDLGPNS